MKTNRLTGTTTGAAAVTLLAPLAWGTTYLTITETLPAGSPMFVAAARVVPAGLLLAALGGLGSRWRPKGAELRRHLLVGLCNFGLFFPLLTVAVQRLPGGVAASAGGLAPLLVALLSWAVAGRRPTRTEIAIGAAAAAGVALVVVRPGAHLDPIGVLAAIASNVAFSTATVLTKRFPTPPHRLGATGWQLLLGGAVLVPVALVVDRVPSHLSAANLAGFAWLSLGCTALSFVVWFDGIRRLPTAAPPLLGLAAPVTGATLGWVVLGQSLSAVQLAGFAITVAAIVRGATLPTATPAATTETVTERPVGQPPQLATACRPS